MPAMLVVICQFQRESNSGALKAPPELLPLGDPCKITYEDRPPYDTYKSGVSA